MTGGGLAISAAQREALTRWLDHLRALKGAADNTLAAYARDLGQFLDFLSHHQGGQAGLAALTTLSQADLRAWMADLRGHEISPRSIARKLSAVKGLNCRGLCRKRRRKTSFRSWAIRRAAIGSPPATWRS